MKHQESFYIYSPNWRGRLQDKLAKLGDRYLGKKQRLVDSIHLTASEIKALAKTVTEEFNQAEPNFLMLEGLFRKNHLRYFEMAINNAIARREIQAHSELGDYLFEAMKDLPKLIREANAAQKDFYKKQNAAGNYPVRYGFLSGMDEQIEQNWILPFQFDQSLKRVPEQSRAFGEMLAKPIPRLATGLAAAAAVAMAAIAGLR